MRVEGVGKMTLWAMEGVRAWSLSVGLPRGLLRLRVVVETVFGRQDMW